MYTPTIAIAMVDKVIWKEYATRGAVVFGSEKERERGGADRHRKGITKRKNSKTT